MKKSTFLTVFSILLFSCNTLNAQWTTANMSSSRTMLAGASAGNKAILAGGIGLISIPSPAADVYNATTTAWSQGTISQGRTSLAGAGTGNTIIFAGGAD